MATQKNNVGPQALHDKAVKLCREENKLAAEEKAAKEAALAANRAKKEANAKEKADKGGKEGAKEGGKGKAAAKEKAAKESKDAKEGGKGKKGGKEKDELAPTPAQLNAKIDQLLLLQVRAQAPSLPRLPPALSILNPEWRREWTLAFSLTPA